MTHYAHHRISRRKALTLLVTYRPGMGGEHPIEGWKGKMQAAINAAKAQDVAFSMDAQKYTQGVEPHLLQDSEYAQRVRLRSMSHYFQTVGQLGPRLSVKVDSQGRFILAGDSNIIERMI